MNDESFPGGIDRRKPPEGDLIHTPSFVRIRKGLGGVATSTLMHSELFPGIVSTFGKGSFTPERLVEGVHRSINDFAAEHTGLSPVLLVEYAPRILSVLVPRQHEREYILELSKQLTGKEEAKARNKKLTLNPKKGKKATGEPSSQLRLLCHRTLKSYKKAKTGPQPSTL